MPVARPAYPQAGDDIVASWAKAVTDFAGDKWRFVPVSMVNSLPMQAENGTTKTFEVTAVPANDPTIAAIELIARVVDPTTTANYTLSLIHFDGTTAGIGYASGVANRGGTYGPVRVVPGGTNGRQIKYVASNGSQAGLWCCGYWVREIPA